MSSSQAIDQDMDSESRFSRVESEKEHNQSLVAQADAQRMQLISPPPEEMLNLRRVSAVRSSPHKSNNTAINATPAKSVSKRKRGPTTPAKPSSLSSLSSPFETEGTPRRSKKATVVKSPHSTNPNADFIPSMVLACDDGFELGKTVVSRALKARGSRRSATPIPPYEPPPDVFTSPREVFLKPLQPKSVSKRSKAKAPVSSSKKGRALKVDTRHVQIKYELPDDLDLLAPMPPASPSDDPLLLKGRPKPIQSSPRMFDDETDEVVQIQPCDFGVGSAGDSSDDDEDRGTSNMDNVTTEDQGVDTSNWEMDTQTEEAPPSTTIEPEDNPLPNLDNQATDIHHETHQSEDDEDSDTDDEPGLVKITSVDPIAAARAVAILKQHDYDCYTKLIKKRRASSSPSTDGFAKETRRRSVSASGVSKSSKHRRRSTMGVIGDKVVIPGSPITTLPELLQKVEKEVANEVSGLWPAARTSLSALRDPFQTPPVNRLGRWVEGPVTPTPDRYPMGEREWSKDDWKLLDACFTDVRLESDPGSGELAPVDFVHLEDVISRFFDLMGGQSLVDTFGEPWTRDNLLRRGSALMKKQRSGNVAPPTTPVLWYNDARGTPDHQPEEGITPPITSPDVYVADDDSRDFGSFLGNEGDHQLEEGITPPITSPDVCVTDDASRDFDSFLGNEGDLSSTRVEPTTNSFDRPIPSTLRGRVKGFLASYLPSLPNPAQKPIKPTRPGLPLPPPSVLEKSRGPVATPIRLPVPRVPHPKELVHLNPAPLPPTSHIPRPKVVPKRLVDLVPVPLPPPKEFAMPRQRRSSGCSVKDLVKGFEHMDKATADEMKPRGMQSVRSNRFSRPMWRP